MLSKICAVYDSKKSRYIKYQGASGFSEFVGKFITWPFSFMGNALSAKPLSQFLKSLL